MENSYEILGLPYGASIEDIKKAYHLYASKLHPDKHDGDPFFSDMFKKVHAAYQNLTGNATGKGYFQFTNNNESHNASSFNMRYGSNNDSKVSDLEKQLAHAEIICSQLNQKVLFLEFTLTATQKLLGIKNDTIDEQNRVINEIREESAQYQGYFKTAVSICVGLIVGLIIMATKSA